MIDQKTVGACRGLHGRCANPIPFPPVRPPSTHSVSVRRCAAPQKVATNDTKRNAVRQRADAPVAICNSLRKSREEVESKCDDEGGPATRN